MICIRCHESFGLGAYCDNCHVHRDRRVVKRIRKRANRPTKHGRNSGKVGTAKNK